MGHGERRFEAGVPRRSPEADWHHYLIASIDELGRLHRHLLERLGLITCELTQTGVAVVLAALREHAARSQYDVRMTDLLDGSEVVACLVGVVDPVVAALHDLHVLLRHRLLLEAEVGEGAVALPVSDQPGHLPVANVKHSSYLRLHLPDLDSACLAAPAVVTDDEYSFCVKLAGSPTALRAFIRSRKPVA